MPNQKPKSKPEDSEKSSDEGLPVQRLVAPLPARRPVPGRIIQRELDERGWTQNDLAAVMGRPAQEISEIITGKKRITVETAHELGEAFGVGDAFWLNLQSPTRRSTKSQSPRN